MRDGTVPVEADRALAKVSERIAYLFHLTPTNADEAFEEFRLGGFKVPPALEYRPLAFDPDALCRELESLDLDEANDTLTPLLGDKRDELLQVMALLRARGTEEFLHGSVRLHGGVEDWLYEEAMSILSHSAEPYEGERYVDAQTFADLAEAEIEALRAQLPALDVQVELRHDMSGLMVVHGNLLVGAGTRFRPERVEPLIQHEIGTHVVTAVNGRLQPLQLLAVGLAHYDETQEAVALLAEHMVGGLSAERIALLSARVVAARRITEGSGFVQVFEELCSLGADRRSSWNTTVRAFRCGGTTKDAIYLRGLSELLAYLERGGALEPLLVGKMPLGSVDIVVRMIDEGFLSHPTVLPRWLAGPGAEARLESLRTGVRIRDLIAREVVSS